MMTSNPEASAGGLARRTAGVAVLSTVLAAACTTPAPKNLEEVVVGISPDNVLNASPLADAAAGVDLSKVEILVVSPEMRAFIDEHVDRKSREADRLVQLLKAVLGGDRFDLAYDDSTRTAASTFANRRGNCISFTNMFIAMARDLGLEARYQEVEIPPNWSSSGQTFLISEHVNVLVEVSNALSRVVDFNSYDIAVDVEHDSVVVSDARARAHYFNNIGVERMLEDDVGLAFANLRQSVREDRSFASPWVNLGILHRREGYPDYAEVAYLEALEHDRKNLMAMSNLANLYQEQGKSQEAQYYLSQVREHRLGNPFYRYRLANIAFEEGDYKAAIKNLKYAIRQKKDEDQFYYLLSLSYLMAGDRPQAQRWMKQAQEVAKATEDKQRYNRKLDLLMGRKTSWRRPQVKPEQS